MTASDHIYVKITYKEKKHSKFLSLALKLTNAKDRADVKNLFIR